MDRFRERGDCVSKLQWTVPIQATTAACCLPLLDPEAISSHCLTLWGNESHLCWELGVHVCPVLTLRGPTSLTPTLETEEGRKEDNIFSSPLWLALSLLMCLFFFLHSFLSFKPGGYTQGFWAPSPTLSAFAFMSYFFFFCHLTYHTYLSVTYFTLLLKYKLCQDRNTANNVQKWFLKWQDYTLIHFIEIHNCVFVTNSSLYD